MATATAKKSAKTRVKSGVKTAATAAVRKDAKDADWGGISSDAVKKATGCDWDRWFKTLDRFGCRELKHKQIAELIYERWPKVGGWWSQMVTVGYEQARGRRERNQSAGSWRVSSSKTVAVPVASLFGAFHDPKRRAAWLKDHKFTVRRATAPKSMRITWVDGKTNIEANFYAKGKTKSSVALQHDKLSDKKHVEKMRAYWTKALEKLKAELEG